VVSRPRSIEYTHESSKQSGGEDRIGDERKNRDEIAEECLG
jgi:hypothetical protein